MAENPFLEVPAGDPAFQRAYLNAMMDARELQYKSRLAEASRPTWGHLVANAFGQGITGGINTYLENLFKQQQLDATLRNRIELERMQQGGMMDRLQWGEQFKQQAAQRALQQQGSAYQGLTSLLRGIPDRTETVPGVSYLTDYDPSVESYESPWASFRSMADLPRTLPSEQIALPPMTQAPSTELTIPGRPGLPIWDAVAQLPGEQQAILMGMQEKGGLPSDIQGLVLSGQKRAELAAKINKAENDAKEADAKYAEALMKARVAQATQQDVIGKAKADREVQEAEARKRSADATLAEARNLALLSGETAPGSILSAQDWKDNYLGTGKGGKEPDRIGTATMEDFIALRGPLLTGNPDVRSLRDVIEKVADPAKRDAIFEAYAASQERLAYGRASGAAQAAEERTRHLNAMKARVELAMVPKAEEALRAASDAVISPTLAGQFWNVTLEALGKLFGVDIAPRITQLVSAGNAYITQLARAVGHTGVLTFDDVFRTGSAFVPGSGDSVGTKEYKIQQMSEFGQFMGEIVNKYEDGSLTKDSGKALLDQWAAARKGGVGLPTGGTTSPRNLTPLSPAEKQRRDELRRKESSP